MEQKQEIKIGALGKKKFFPYHYIYVGSALNNLKKRIERHLRVRDNEKKCYWHIDYLRERGRISKIIYGLTSKDKECSLAQSLNSGLSFVKKFGCSDCSCESHLFYSSEFKGVNKKAKEAYKDSGLYPQEYNF